MIMCWCIKDWIVFSPWPRTRLANLFSMSNLNPTRIVDKNGKLTTVHKRTAPAPAAGASLGAVKPSLGGSTKKTRKASEITKVKATGVKRFHEDSLFAKHASSYELTNLEYGHGEYAWRHDDLEIPTARLYDYMRKGIDLTDASVAEGLDLSPDALELYHPEDIPGRLGKTKERGYEVPVKNQKVIDAMQEAGVPALKAYKALENGLQDGHMENLSIDQLVPLFGKWRYYGRQGTLPDQNSSRLLDAVTSGNIPVELTETTTRQELSRLENELKFTASRGPLLELLGRDRDLFIRLAEKAVKTMDEPILGPDNDKPVSKMLKLYEKHGEGVLDMIYPELLNRPKRNGDEWVELTLEEAQYMESVERMATSAGDNVGWSWKDSYNDIRANIDRDVKLSQNDLAAMHGAGISAEDAYEMLIVRKLTVGSALSAHADNVPASISEGAL